jgi:hypothetical protein
MLIQEGNVLHVLHIIAPHHLGQDEIDGVRTK